LWWALQGVVEGRGEEGRERGEEEEERGGGGF
jgi:hypothetical protein